MRDLEYFANLVSASIETFDDDSFQENPDEGFEALLIPIRDEADVIIDVVAWRMGTDRPWYRLRKIGDVLGYKALAGARWPRLGYPLHDPCIMLYETPKAWLAAYSPNAVCILDWGADLDSLFRGISDPVYCNTKELREYLESKLQGIPHNLKGLLRGFE